MRLLKLVIAGAVVSGIASVAQAEVRVIASNPQGSIFYASSVVIGKLLDEKLKIQMRVQPMGGSSTYIPLLDRGEVDFGLTNVDDALSSYKGVGNFKRPSSELRLTAVAFPLTLGVIVPNDSPIRSIGDLKGKILPWGYNAQTTGRVLQEAVLATAGLTMNDVKTVPTQSLFSGVDLLGDGKVDAAVISVGTGQAQQANVNLASHGGLRFLNMDSSPEAIARRRGPMWCSLPTMRSASSVRPLSWRMTSSSAPTRRRLTSSYMTSSRPSTATRKSWSRANRCSRISTRTA